MAQNPRQLWSLYFWELLNTYCAGESVSSRVGQIRRRTLGACPAFANPVTANFTRSRRFLDIPFLLLIDSHWAKCGVMYV
jgi:hypothetical protein